MNSKYVSVEAIVKRYMFHAEEKAGKEISQIINEVEKHNEAMIPISILEDIKSEIEDLDVSGLGKMGIITVIFGIIDNHISRKERK